MMGNEVNSFVFAGNGCFANKGCEAIVRGTSTILSEVFGEAKFYSAYSYHKKCNDKYNEIDAHVTHIPIKGIERFSLKWFEYRFLKIFRIPNPGYLSYYYLDPYIKKSKAVLMLGGDNYSLDYGYPDSVFTLNRFVKERGKPVILWGASIGPFSKDPEYEKKVAYELSYVDRIYVRETETQKYLSSIGIEENVRLSADPSYWMKPEVTELNPIIEAMIRSGSVGLNLSPLVFRATTKNIGQRIEKSIELLVNLTEKLPYPILLIPHVASHDSNIRGDDYLFLKSVLDQLPSRNSKVALLENHYSASQTKWIISRLITFAGARTHSTFAALSSGVPTISIGYSIKAEGINQDIYGSKDWLIRNHDITPALFTQKMLDLIKMHGQIQNHLISVEPIYKQRALSSGIDLRNLLSVIY
jgi:colanic acid/amylovoran biosynthesis protein